jgi:hypothetical protein
MGAGGKGEPAAAEEPAAGAAGLKFPPPPKTKTFNAEALRTYRLTRAVYEDTPALGQLLCELGADDTGAKVYASRKGSELQLHVSDVMAALERLKTEPAAEGWEAWAIGKDDAMRRRANRLGLTPTKDWLARAEAAGLGDALDCGGAGGDAMPQPHEKETAQTRLARAVADGASLDEPDTFKTNKHYTINSDVEDIYRRWDQQVSVRTPLVTPRSSNARVAAALP